MASQFELQVQLWEEEKDHYLDQTQKNSAMRARLKAAKAKRDTTTFVNPAAPEEIISLGAYNVSENEGWMTGEEENRKSDAPWMPSEGYAHPNSNMFLQLHEELMDFLKWLKLSKREEEARIKLMSRLNGIAKQIVPGSEIEVFGSYYTGLSLPSSDLDLVWLVRIPFVKDPYERHPEVSIKRYRENLLRDMADHLLREQQVSEIEVRSSARIPIVAFKDRLSNPPVSADISIYFEGLQSRQLAEAIFQKQFPTETGKFVMKEGIDRYPHFAPIILFFKTFLQQRNLAETFSGGIGSYLLSVLVIVFLQMHEMSVNPEVWHSLSLGHLVYEFLRWVTIDLKIDQEGLSAANGGQIFRRRDRRFQFSKAVPGGAICVESPLEPNVDIGNKAFNWKSCRISFTHALHMLNERILSWDHNTEEAKTRSLLSSLIQPGHDMFRHRNLGEDSVATSEPTSIPCPLTGVGVDLEFQEPTQPIDPSKLCTPRKPAGKRGREDKTTRDDSSVKKQRSSYNRFVELEKLL